MEPTRNRQMIAGLATRIFAETDLDAKKYVEAAEEIWDRAWDQFEENEPRESVRVFANWSTGDVVFIAVLVTIFVVVSFVYFFASH